MRILILITILLVLTKNLYCQGFNFVFHPSGVNEHLSLRFDHKENKLVCDKVKSIGIINQAITFTDSDENLIGYFNGHQVRNKDGNLALNGDSLAWTPSLDWLLKRNTSDKNEGSGIWENALILPTENDSIFLLFYLDFMHLTDIDNFLLPYMLEANEIEFRWYSKALLMSQVCLMPNGQLRIDNNKKDIPIIEDFLMYRNLMAVPHANGKEFWIVVPCQHENTAYSILVSDTIIDVKGKHYFSENNTKYLWQQQGTSKFSLNGEKLLRFNYRYGTSEAYESGFIPCILEVIDFDRCKGKVVPGTSTTDILDIPWFVTAEFSPSGEYLYIGGVYFLARCKTNAPSFFDRLDTIYHIPYEGLTTYELYNNYDHSECMNRLPNGQIICHSYWQTPYFHIITNPDAPDVKDIGYRSRAIILPEKEIGSDIRYKAGGMPRHVNLKMDQKTCIIETEETKYVHNISVYPNPVYDVLYLKGYADKSFTDIKFSIIDLVTGQLLVKNSQLKETLDVSFLKSGFYGIKIDEKVIKFVKI